MDYKKLSTAGLAASVVVLILSWLWHQFLMNDFYTTNTAAVAREEINMLYVVLGILVLGFLMAYLYPIGYKGGPPLREGLRFGVIIGLVWILPWSLIIHGIWNVPLNVIIVDALWHLVEEGIAGIVVAFIYGTAQ